MFGLTPALTMEREVLSKANLGFLAQRSCGFFPPSLPNALILAQSYGGRSVFAKELSMIVRI